jgi:hypothetical protein
VGRALAVVSATAIPAGRPATSRKPVIPVPAYSQPFSRASRSASMRFRAPDLPIAEER